LVKGPGIGLGGMPTFIEKTAGKDELKKRNLTAVSGVSKGGSCGVQM